MKSTFAWRFLLKTALPVIVATLAALYGLHFILKLSSDQTDRIAITRQEALGRMVLDQLRRTVEHDQESATVWDDAVEAVKASPPDIDWINANLGSWMHSYFQQDEIYIFNEDMGPIYVFRDGQQVKPAMVEYAALEVSYLVEELRSKLRSGDASEINDQVLTPGASDFLFLNGRPAVASLKPIVSDTGDIQQTPGKEFIHLAIRYLDGGLLSTLASKYQFTNLRFMRSYVHQPDFADIEIKSRSGSEMGFLVWDPYLPGSDFAKQVTPALWSGAVALLLAVILTLRVLYHRSRTVAQGRERIEYLAFHDELTGLFNRRAFEQHLDAAIAASALEGQQTAVIYLDIDRLKKVNDTLGHAAGDHVIQRTGSRIKTLLGSEGELYRIGGDEFTAIVGKTHPDDIAALCDRIIGAVSEPLTVGENSAHVGISIGVAFCPEHGTNPSELARKADVSLYHAKASGKNTFVFFGKHMDSIIKERSELEDDLRDALQDFSQFRIYFQPKYSSGTDEISGLEALVRWQHPDRGFITPSIFIPLAEEVGLITRLGFHVLEEACRQAVHWPVQTLAVNVSALQLLDPFFAVRAIAILEKYRFDPKRLEIELTETVLAEHSSVLSSNLKQLHDIGVSIALDDFGTGFSSFARLKDLNFNRIKIDKSFVDGLGKASGDEDIVNAIIQMARAKNLKTTAEGVETAGQRDFLKEAGCEELQGFLWSQAKPASDIVKMLDTARLKAVVNEAS